ncbi:hypothetical protein LSP04_24750 [Levilactobacillus spicheri]|uniref:Uncharacterized protein n=1 Tax=Levilactobacillus spicheri TaxID=216463 RepID=A0ABQ0WST5_9LACO|nr:hypothetical protein LSP04_24750 [Levilactobacillus spicheri]
MTAKPDKPTTSSPITGTPFHPNTQRPGSHLPHFSFSNVSNLITNGITHVIDSAAHAVSPIKIGKHASNNSHKVRVKAARHWFQGRLFHQAQTITSRDAKKTYIVTRQITLATNDHKDTFVEVTPERWAFAPIKHWIHIDNVTPIK